YGACHAEVLVPIFASLDGFLEVMHTGFQSIFILGENEVSRPRFEKMLQRIKASSQKRAAQIADVGLQMLAGKYEHPEAKLVLAEGLAKSALHNREIDFQDFHPRGPYDASAELRNYFRAFKYLNQLRVSPEERSALRADAALVAAWKEWVGAQA